MLVKGQKNSKRVLNLRGLEGNAFCILGQASSFCKQLKEVDPEKYDWDRINTEMTSGDYKNLVLTFEKYFGDYITIYGAEIFDK